MLKKTLYDIGISRTCVDYNAFVENLKYIGLVSLCRGNVFAETSGYHKIVSNLEKHVFPEKLRRRTNELLAGR